MRQSLITGMGIYSCLGQSLQEVSDSLRLGCSGIGIAPERLSYGYQSPLTGILPPPDLSHEPLRSSHRRCMAEQTAYAYLAVKQAIEQAKLTDLSHVALIVSNDSTAEAAAVTEQLMNLHHDSRRLGGFHVFRSLNSTTSMSLASIFGIGGLSLTVSAACAGGGHAIGLAHELIQAGVIDCAIIVGAQEVGAHSYIAFDALGVFSRRTDDPTAASRPFDTARDGLVPSGGAAVLILESSVHFECRLSSMPSHRDGSAPTSEAAVPDGFPFCLLPAPLAAVLGYGFSTSPNIVTPSPDSILASMQMALDNNEVLPPTEALRSLSTIFPHATSTRDGDTAEATAIATLLSSTSFSPLIIPTKALTGHECWMSGVSQVVYALLQAQGHFAAPHPHLADLDPSAASLHIPTAPTAYTHSIFLCNSFGFGGTNASLLLQHLQ